jgi:aminopeptidase N
MRRTLAFTVLTLASACAHEATPPSPLAPAARAPEPAPSAALTSALVDAPAPREDGRLPGTAIPRHYALDLNVDPRKDRFEGEVTIDVDLPAPTSHVVLHAHDLAVHDVMVTSGSAAVSGTAEVREAKGGVAAEELVLSFPQALPAGRAVLSITYDAPFDASLSGLYRVKDGERWYAFTQFESTAARRAFPCFDEPGFKVPFDLAITTPKGMIAVANTPETSRAEAGGSDHFVFATSPPLPSYLVAFAVGDFDVREGVKTPVPIRLIAVKGKGAQGDLALDAAAGLVKYLGDYFGRSYPFAKLDVVAVPEFAAGAMENPGLVTFRDEILLSDPQRAGVVAQRRMGVVVAHELAHIWFGDLVTMKWWNDVWLNEGFATWMETKAANAWRRDDAESLNAIDATVRAMDTDALPSSRAVRQPVASTSEIEETFDEISYEKGAAVLRMIERWIGPAAMQKGVRDYLDAHAWQSAEAADLLGALDRASGRDVSGLAATFLDRPGVPTVSVTPSCDAGALTLALEQSAWHPLGVAPRGTDGAPWRVPVCARAGASETCTLLEGAHSTVTAGKCAPWVLPNAGELGYFRASLPEASLRAVVRSAGQLDAASRMGLIADAWAQTRAGELGPDALLSVLAGFDHETDGHVESEIVRTLYGVEHTLVEASDRAGFRAYVTARLGGAKRRLGWDPKPGESADDTMLRRIVLGAMGDLARDPATLREAEVVAARWLRDPSAVDPDVAAVAVPIASIRAGAPRLDELRAAAARARTPGDRLTALRAMGMFEDKAILERAWGLALTDEIRQQDVGYVLEGVESPQRHTRRVPFAWVATHWDALRKKAALGYEEALVEPLRRACRDEDIAEEMAFFEPRAKELQGAMRPLAENADRARACSAQRAHGAAAVAKYFGRR